MMIFILIFFFSKCNKEMVELLPLKENDDLTYVHDLLMQFKEKTGSLIADELVKSWPASSEKFVKVSLTAQQVSSTLFKIVEVSRFAQSDNNGALN